MIKSPRCEMKIQLIIMRRFCCLFPPPDILCKRGYDMRVIKSSEELFKFVAACVHKCSVTDASKLFIVSCENPKHFDLRKFIGFCVATVGADAFLAPKSFSDEFTSGYPFPADGIFTIYEKKSEIYVGVKFYSGRSEEACLSYPIKRTGSVFTINEGVKVQKTPRTDTKIQNKTYKL